MIPSNERPLFRNPDTTRYPVPSPNTNPETGIRYGVVALNTLADWVFEEFFHHGNNDSYDAALEYFKAENPDATDEEIDRFGEEYESDEDCYSLETKDGLKLGLSYLGGAPMVWVFQSPHTTTALLCSPCVPNAGDLDNRTPDGFACYTLPADWFHTED
jgi:hypothetical protein